MSTTTSVSKDLSGQIPMLDGTNFQVWENFMIAYLCTTGYYNYVTGQKACPELSDDQKKLLTQPSTSKETADAYKDAKDIEDKIDLWIEEDWKALGVITLKCASSIHYLLDDTSRKSWINIKSAFNKPGTAAVKNIIRCRGVQSAGRRTSIEESNGDDDSDNMRRATRR